MTVRKEDVIQEGLFQDEITKGKELIKVLDGINSEFDELLNKSREKIVDLDPKDLKSIQDFNKEFQKSKTILSEKEKVQAKTIAAEKKLQQALRENNKELVKNQERLKILNREKRQEARATDKQIGAYDRASASLNVLVRRYQNLAAAEKTNTKEAKNLLNQITKLDTKLKSIDQTVGRSQRNVGDYAKTLKGLRSGFQNVASAAGVTFGIFGAFNVVKNAGKIITGFEDSLSSLNALLGATAEESAFFREEARKIGRDLDLTATAEEAVGAFELVGSAAPELLKNKEALVDVTRDALLLADAANIDVDSAVKSLTGTLNQFNLAGAESSRVINSIAAGSQAGSATIPQISDAIDKFGAVAADSNVTVEQSVALIETLAEKNLKGAEAGNKLKNVLLTLNTASSLPPKALKELEAFGVNTDIVADKSLSLEERLRELGKIAQDDAALVKVFGKENLLAGKVILDNVDKVEKYTEAVTGTNTALEQANAQTDNLTGDLGKLSKAWEDIVLSTDEATGANESFRNAIQFVTTNLDTILQTVLAVTAAWVSWKVAVFAWRRAMDVRRLIVWIKALKNSEKLTKAMAIAQKVWATITGVLTGKIKLAAVAQRAFGLASKLALGPIGLVIAGITALVAVFSLFGSAAADAEEKLKKLKKTLEDTKATEAQLSNKFLADITNSVQKVVNAEQQRLDLLRAQGASRAKLAQEEVKSNEIISKSIDDSISQINKALSERTLSGEDSFVAQIQAANDELLTLNQEIEKIEGGAASIGLDGFIRAQPLRDEAKLQEEIIESLIERKKQAEDLAKISIEQLKTQKLQLQNENEVTKETRRQTTLLQRKKEQLSQQQKLLEKSFNTQLQEDFNKKEETRAVIAFNANKQRAKDLQKEIKEIEALLSIVDKKAQEAKKKAENDKSAEKASQTIRKIDQEVVDREIKQREDLIEDEIELTVDGIRRTGEASREELDRQTALLFQQKKQTIEDERDFLLSNEKLTQLERELIIEKANTKLQNLEREELEFRKDINDEISAAQLERQDMEVKSREEFYNNLNQLADAFAERERKRSQERINDINKEIQKREERVSKLEQLAQQENSNAAETIAFEERRIAELERKKKKEEAKQQLVEVALAAFKAYTSELESGKKPVQALGSTFKNITLLSQFVRSIPSFDVGSENLSSTQNVDGKGGFLAVNHVGEGIMTYDQNQERLKSGLTMDQTVELTKLYSQGAFEPNYVSSTYNVDMKPLQNEIKALRSDMSKMEITKGLEYDKIHNTIIQTIVSLNGKEKRSSKVKRG